VTEPVAIPQPPSQPGAPPAQAATQYAVDTFQTVTGGRNAPPPTSSSGVPDDVAMTMFAKIAAERRERVGQLPLEVPFGSGTIRIHRTMPAGFAFDAQAAEVDAHAAKRMLRDAIIPEDHAKFDAIMLQPPSNPDSVDGLFLLGFLEALAELYTGVPLGVRSR
jgi:hypothetical protein